MISVANLSPLSVSLINAPQWTTVPHADETPTNCDRMQPVAAAGVVSVRGCDENAGAAK
jgi:hypothetical protein